MDGVSGPGIGSSCWGTASIDGAEIGGDAVDASVAADTVVGA